MSVEDSTGITRTLKDGTPDVWDLAAKADRFKLEGRWLSRVEMEKQLDQMKPANVSQISLVDSEHMDTDPKWKK